MNRRRFATPSSKLQSPSLALAPELTLSKRLANGQRLPLDVALSLAAEVVESVALVHQQHRVFGGFGPEDVNVMPDGSVSILLSTRASEDVSLDIHSLGVVLYQVLTGLTPNQARAKLAVSPLHAPPPASLVNPALDDSLEILLAQLLDSRTRVHSVRVAEAALEEYCESFDLEPSRALVASWAAEPVVAPKPVPVAVAPLKRHVPSVQFMAAEDDEDFGDDDEDVVTSSNAVWRPRFDAWAAALCAFGVAAFVLATKL